MLSRFKKVKRTMALLLVLPMALPALTDQSFAATQTIQFSDIKGHWAESTIQAGIEKGWVLGYEDGTFKPNEYMTRAEFMNLVNRTFAYTAQAKMDYRDVSANAWYHEAVSIATAAGYINGYS